jgi:hypothetical protein
MQISLSQCNVINMTVHKTKNKNINMARGIILLSTFQNCPEDPPRDGAVT